MEGRQAYMNPVYITDVFAITSMGPDLESLYNGLMDQKSGISKIAANRGQTTIQAFTGTELDDAIMIDS